MCGSQNDNLCHEIQVYSAFCEVHENMKFALRLKEFGK